MADKRDSGDDPSRDSRVTEIADEYLARLQAGDGPDREALLATHPDIADALTIRLDVAEATLSGTGVGGSATIAAGAPSELGHYRLERLLGRGGMGEVHLAHDTKLERAVALKILPVHLAGDAVRRQRFATEAKAAAALNHPGIVTIHSIEEVDGVHFITMEHVEGTTLGEEIPESGMAIERLVECGRQLAEALAAAHETGVVHRDLKPSNVMVTASGGLKILDFGVALLHRPPGADSLTVGDENSVTGAGLILGTVPYMSPEQAEGKDVDARSDLFSLGVMLYQMATGRRPFRGKTPMAVAAAVIREEPLPLEEVRPEIPSAVARVVARCLAKDREERFDSAVELKEALESYRVSRLRAELKADRAERSKGNVPAERDAFVGREAELAEIGRRLDEGTRLLVILGTGGTGKTRLVQRFGLVQRDRWPGGVWFCDLTEARSVHGIASAVAQALDVPLGKDDPIVQLGRAIAGRGRCLLILDNFEQVAEYAEATVGKWLERADEGQFVVTSRVRLEVGGEEDIALEPLPLESEGIELFATRAHARRSDFELTDANRAEVLAIVRQVDSLPLAIELAAARVRLLSLGQIRERLKDRFVLLTGGKKATHHSTLRVAIDWSWNLLEEWEKAALAQGSVFEGGFTLEAAEAVLDLSEWDEAPDVMDVVQALVDKSLLRTSMLSEGTSEERYFRLYASTHEYASDKLQTAGAVGESGSGVEALRAALNRHDVYFAGFGTDEALREEHKAGVWRQALALGDLVAAFHRGLDRGDGAMATAAFRGAWAVLRRQGPHVTAVEMGRDLVERDDLSQGDRARALQAVGLAIGDGGHLPEAKGYLEAALALVGGAGEGNIECQLLNDLGDVHWKLGRAEEARDYYQRAIAREVGARVQQCRAVGQIGALFLSQGELTKAQEKYELALEMSRELGFRSAEGAVLCNQGVLHEQAGRFEDARRLYDATLAIGRELGDRYLEGTALHNLASSYVEVGRIAEARVLLEQAEVVAHAFGDVGMVARNLCLRAECELKHGDIDAARAALTEAEGHTAETGVEANSELGQEVARVRAAVDAGLSLPK